MPRPKNKKNAKYHVSRPDGDNLLKFWADSANGILFEDDSQIVKFSVLKIYADIPYWQFRVTELEETV
jgi:Holliday junction resolvase RusA-like endonuclease